MCILYILDLYIYIYNKYIWQGLVFCSAPKESVPGLDDAVMADFEELLKRSSHHEQPALVAVPAAAAAADEVLRRQLTECLKTQNISPTFTFTFTFSPPPRLKV